MDVLVGDVGDETGRIEVGLDPRTVLRIDDTDVSEQDVSNVVV